MRAKWPQRNPASPPPSRPAIRHSTMVTKTSELQRSERTDGCSNNALPVQVVAVHKDSAPADDGELDMTDAVLSIETVRESTFRGLSNASRPMLWRILLGVVEGEDPKKAPVERRAQYHCWRREFQSFRAHSHEMEPGDGKPSEKTNTAEDCEHSFLNDAALMREIDKDVSRTQSELPFFSDGSIQQQWMLRILFVYAKLNPELGYMQGMNEILAPLLFVFGSDDNDDWASEAEPDAFYAFSDIMSSVKLLYKPSPSDPSKTGVDMQITRLAVLLRQHDALLWQHLNSIGLSPDFYSFRWYMTLLAREFSMTTTLRIWDALLADPKRFSFLHYVSLALIRSQRAKLLHEGFSDALKLLQSLPTIEVEAVLEQAQQMREKDRSTDRRRNSLVEPAPLVSGS